MPKHEIHIPPEHQEFFLEIMHELGGTIFSTDVTTPLDYAREIALTYNQFVTRIRNLNQISANVALEAQRANGYRRLLADIGTKSYNTADLERIDYPGIIIPFRTALIERFERMLNPEPKKVLEGNVRAAIGIPPVESLVLLYGLEDGVILIERDVEKLTGIPATQVRNAHISFVRNVRIELREPVRLPGMAQPFRQTVIEALHALGENVRRGSF